MKSWQCSVCKYIHKGDEPPEKCPVCGVDGSRFVELEESQIPEKKKPAPKPVEEKDTASVEPVKKETPPDKPAAEPEEKPPGTLKDKIETLLVKHHAHPVTVHTPNGVLPMSVILYVIAWLFDVRLPADAAMIGQIFVVVSLPVVIYTGTLEWRKKYNAAMTPIFKLKILAAALTTASCVITLAWYLLDDALLTSPKAGFFILINLFMLICAGAAGHIGGKLVFKD